VIVDAGLGFDRTRAGRIVMAPERESDVAREANEADFEEQHLPLVDEDDEDAPSAPHVDRVPLEAPEADVLDQSRAEPWDEDEER